MDPAGARVARWYCPQGHTSFSLLPDCLAARLPGALCALESVVLAVEHAPSQEAAADGLRPDVELPGALRWMRRRVRKVHSALTVLRGLRPELFAQCPSTITEFRERLGVQPVLPALRELAASQLSELPAPLGFRSHVLDGGESPRRRQHNTGADPPSAAG